MNLASIKGGFLHKEEEGKIERNHSGRDKLVRDLGVSKTSRMVFGSCFCSAIIQ